MTTKKLVIEGIRVGYGSTVILDDFSLEVNDGETVAVIGPSGSGKSTLLRAIAGLEPLIRGRILLDGVDLAGVAPHQRGVGLMFQDHALFPHLTVNDNIGYGLDRAGLSGRERQIRVAEMLEMVGLDQFGSRAIDQLSGGEAQRVALARALAPSPGLLMLDEPLGSLDRVLRDQLIDDLDLLLHQMGQTSLHVTHDQAEAFALADRVAVLANGVLSAHGTPRDLWEKPRTRLVAEFLGRPNIWSLGTADDGSKQWIETGLVVGNASDAGTTAATMAGSTSVVIPVDAFTEVQSGTDSTVAGDVVGSRFHQGRYRHRLRVGPDHTVVFVDDADRSVGEPVVLKVDLSSAIILEGGG